MAAKGFLRLALAADPVTTNSSLHARAKLVANLIVEVARLRAQEVPVMDLVNNLHHPFHFSELAVVTTELG